MNNDLILKNNVRKIRTSKKMSQEELAKLTGTTRQTIIAVEKGVFNPSAKLACLISIALESKFEELFYVE